MNERLKQNENGIKLLIFPKWCESGVLCLKLCTLCPPFSFRHRDAVN